MVVKTPPASKHGPVVTDHKSSDAENELLGGDEDEDEEAITGLSAKERRIVLTKRTYLLFAFVVVTILSIGATVYTFVFYLDEYDYPPTEFSNASIKDTLYGLIALTIVTPIGFVILKFRITNLLIGLLYLFLLVPCLIIPAKGIAEGLYSLNYDTENNIHNFAKNPTLDKKIHNFWAVFQKQHSCCGTKEFDRIEDWPYFLNSTDFPATCCTEKQLKYAESLSLLIQDEDEDFVAGAKRHRPELDVTTSYCGLGLARTRTKGLGFNKLTLPKRVFSGFFLSLTLKQKDKLYAKLKGAFHANPENILVEMLDIVEDAKNVEVNALGSFRRIWKNYYIDSVCNSWDDFNAWRKAQNSSFQIVENPSYCTTVRNDNENDIAYPSDMNHTSRIKSLGVIRSLPRAIFACKTRAWPVFKEEMKNLNLSTGFKNAIEYCDKLLPQTRQNVTTIGRELLLQMDYLTSYIYEFGRPIGNPPSPVPKNTWMLWPISTRFDPDEMYPYKLNANYLRVDKPNKRDQRLKRMYYFSRGISENFLLQSIIHEKTCESLNPSHIPSIKKKLSRDLNKRWRRAKPYSDWKNQDEGLGKFFLFQVRKITIVTIAVSGSCIFCVVILAVVFWQYYSRIKAEEYANLALPKEFEVLHLRRGSLIDDADIAREMRKHKRNRFGHRGGRMGTPSGLSLHGVHHGNRSRHVPGLPGTGRGQVHTPGYGRGQNSATPLAGPRQQAK